MPRQLKVKSVKNYLESQDIQVVYALQQLLEWFGVSKRLERIVWSILRRYELDSKRAAEEATRFPEETKPSDKKPDPRRRRRYKVAEPVELTMPVGLCDCGGILYGESVPSCESRVSGRIFFKECNSCSYYSELFKIDKKYKEIEGG